MGWSSGSYLAQNIWDKLKYLIPEENHQEAAEVIVSHFESEDADDWDNADEESVYLTARPEEKSNDEDEDY